MIRTKQVPAFPTNSHFLCWAGRCTGSTEGFVSDYSRGEDERDRLATCRQMENRGHKCSERRGHLRRCEPCSSCLIHALLKFTARIGFVALIRERGHRAGHEWVALVLHVGLHAMADTVHAWRHSFTALDWLSQNLPKRD